MLATMVDYHAKEGISAMVKASEALKSGRRGEAIDQLKPLAAVTPEEAIATQDRRYAQAVLDAGFLVEELQDCPGGGELPTPCLRQRRGSALPQGVDKSGIR
jgi:hypothetical protein